MVREETKAGRAFGCCFGVGYGEEKGEELF